MKSKTLVFLLFIVLSACRSDDAKPTFEAEEYFEKVWNDFDKTYSYFELKKVDWDSVYRANRDKIDNKTSLAELEHIIGRMTMSLKDIHVNFIAGDRSYHYSNKDLFPGNSPENNVNYLSSTETNSKTLLIGKIKNRNIQYAWVKNLRSTGDFDPLFAMLDNLDGSDGLILDLRDNYGGNDGIARDFVNRLTKIERVHEYIRYRNGPGHNDFEAWRARKLYPQNPVDFNRSIVVLTNRNVVSSGEGFVSMLMVLPNVIIVGDTTRGATANPKEYTLSNGWKYRVSSWQAVTADYEFIEDRGIAPNVVVYNSESSIAEGKDLILEKAIEIVD